MFGFCVDILRCFKRKKTGLFSLFLQMLLPFTRWPDTAHQLKGDIYLFWDKGTSTQHKMMIAFKCLLCLSGAMLPAPLGLPSNLLLGFILAKWGPKCRQRTQVRTGKKTWSYKRNPEHEKSTTGNKKNHTPTTEPTTDLAEKTWSWQQTDQQWLRGRQGLKYTKPDQLIEHRCGAERAGKQTKTVRRHKNRGG